MIRFLWQSNSNQEMNSTKQLKTARGKFSSCKLMWKAANKDLTDVHTHTHTCAWQLSAAEVDVVRAGSSRQNLGNWLKWNTAMHTWQVKITKFWETRGIHQCWLSSGSDLLCCQNEDLPVILHRLNPACFHTTLVCHHKMEFNHQNGLITRDERQVEIRVALQIIELVSRSVHHLKKWVMGRCSSRVFSIVTRTLLCRF